MGIENRRFVVKRRFEPAFWNLGSLIPFGLKFLKSSISNPSGSFGNFMGNRGGFEKPVGGRSPPFGLKSECYKTTLSKQLQKILYLWTFFILCNLLPVLTLLTSLVTRSPTIVGDLVTKQSSFIINVNKLSPYYEWFQLLNKHAHLKNQWGMQIHTVYNLRSLRYEEQKQFDLLYNHPKEPFLKRQ